MFKVSINDTITYFTSFFSVSTVKFEQVNAGWGWFLSMTSKNIREPPAFLYFWGVYEEKSGTEWVKDFSTN